MLYHSGLESDIQIVGPILRSMRADEFFIDDEALIDFPDARRFDRRMVAELRRAPLPATNDVEAAVPLARLVHDELETYGTSGGQQLNDLEMRDALLALRAVLDRLGLEPLEAPFRDFTTFRNYWIRAGAKGSWQARRDLLAGIFDPIHDSLIELEAKQLVSSLADPVSPRGRTGWAKVDEEIAELRRHFQSARTPQDYRNVGNDCVSTLEALSQQVYVPERHLRAGEPEPPVSKTKQRLERVVEDALSGAENAASRKLVRASIELAQEVKHRETPTRREAGFAADTVILLANLFRRLDEPVC